MLERDLIKQIKTLIESKGGLCIKQHGSVFSMVGVPDLLICYHGIFCACEVKIKPNKPTPCQLARIKAINDAGGYAIWTDNIEKVEELLETVDKYKVFKFRESQDNNEWYQITL